MKLNQKDLEGLSEVQMKEKYIKCSDNKLEGENCPCKSYIRDADDELI